jgi:lipoyl(octanoyl) transferase
MLEATIERASFEEVDNYFRLSSDRLMETGLDMVVTAIAAIHDQIQLPVFYLGRQAYIPVLELQRYLHRLHLVGKIGDVVLLLEHDPVYTFGKNADHANLLPGRPADAEVIQTDRGGEITFHGPGQLVGYPIIDLKEHRPSVTWYMRTLESILIELLSDYGIEAGRKAGLTGVWVGERKIAALGVRLAKWVTMHGFALNVDVDPVYTDGMIPCGISDYEVVNLNELVKMPMTTQELIGPLTTIIRKTLA